MVYDLIIIGAGPAGMTAGVYAARKKLKTLILSQDIGGQAAWSSDVENYLGFTMITGADLVEKFEHHVEQFKDVLELRLVTKGVSEIKKEKTYFSVQIKDGNIEHARAVIIAGGKIPRPLGVAGEKEFLNRGVTYCAWCDGPLFAGKDVAIVGGGNSALDAALNIERTVKSIVIINVTPELTGDPVMIDKITASPHVRVINDSEVVSVNGEKFVNSITIQNHKIKKPSTIDVAGVFIEVGSLPATGYLKSLIKLNKASEIIIDKYNMTSREGIFAAGDITDIPEKQIITAAGEGAKAAICAAQYIARSAK
ncbi:MAG: FAD-dependent oxidoreductase [Patescibacteria group bacterium]|jgi:NADH-dependent peroxiredoxin subunit F|nr:FAD-dependent oxidoreductase [Patescibacteria group bacterium]